MRKFHLQTASLSLGFAIAVTLVSPRPADAGHSSPASFVPPVVFQAAGPNAASIQSTVDAFRAALGNPNNGNTAGSNITEGDFFVPGTNGTTLATVSGFGVFTDVDQPDGSGPANKRGNRHASTRIDCFGVRPESRAWA